MAPKKDKILAACAACEVSVPDKCCFSSKGVGSKGCPTLMEKALLTAAVIKYSNPQTNTFARQASIQEGECYANRQERPYVMQPTKTRIVEIYEFAGKMGYQRLGLAFCLGLTQEAKVVEQVFKAQGFDVVSVICKAGRIPKEEIGIKEDEKIYRGTEEVMCNPIYQAMILNQARTEFNILLGLCVGHDSLFFKQSDAPTTVLAVKDRVTGHNPLAAVYLSGTYYKKMLSKK